MSTMFYQSAGDGGLRALVWKDYRANRFVLIVGALLSLMPYLVIAFVLLRDRLAGPRDLGYWQSPQLELTLMLTGMCSLGLSCLTFALLGSNLIAGERADGSAEFLGSLPPSRTRILAGKAIVAVTTFLVIWGGNLLLMSVAWSEILAIADSGGVDMSRAATNYGSACAGFAVTSLMLFGVAWLGSSLWSSPTFAIAPALPIPLAIMGLFHVCEVYLGWPAEEASVRWLYIGTCTTLGLLCLVGGTWHYLRRVEP